MRPLRYSINVTVDGCVDHRAIEPDEAMHHDIHRIAEENIAKSDGIILGRITYELMEGAWRLPPDGKWPDWMPDWMQPFAKTMDAARKYLVSNTLKSAEWNTELIRGDQLVETIRKLKQEPGKGLGLGGVKLPLALAEAGLIDEYEFIVLPQIAGHGPTLFAGLSKHVDLRLMDRREFASGVVAMRYEPKH